MARILATALAFCLLLLASGSARADAQSRLGLSLMSVVSGNEEPGLVIQPEEGVVKLVVKLKRDDGRTSTVSAAGVAAGTEKKLVIKQEPGQFSYEANFEVKWEASEPSTFSMRFTMTRVKKLELQLAAEDVDLDARHMSFKINNPAKKAELIIVGQDGKQLKTFDKTYAGAAPRTTLEIDWDDPGADILYMDLKVYDVAGFWKGVRLTPFSISIPHDDVEFENGKWAIRKSEEPKLDKTMKHIRDALEKHGTLLTLKLYVAGYTDTVGSKPSNQTLSNNRARAIANWFRAHGLKIPIFHQGFGETVLAVQTPDETAEPKNRRAIYILSSQIPSKSDTIPKQDWNGI